MIYLGEGTSADIAWNNKRLGWITDLILQKLWTIFTTWFVQFLTGIDGPPDIGGSVPFRASIYRAWIDKLCSDYNNDPFRCWYISLHYLGCYFDLRSGDLWLCKTGMDQCYKNDGVSSHWDGRCMVRHVVCISRAILFQVAKKIFNIYHIYLHI